MAQSGRARRPGSPRTGPARPARPTAPPPSPTRRPPASAPSAPSADPVETRLKAAGRPKDPARPDRAPDLKVDRPSPVQRAFRWLLEDPSKKKRRSKSEREKALEAMAARGGPSTRPAVALGPSSSPPPSSPSSSSSSSPSPAARTAKGPAGLKARLLAALAAPRSASPAKKTAKEPSAAARLVHRALGEATTTDEYGERVVVPPPRSDWRFRVSRFLRSDVRAIALLRTSLLVLLLVASTWTVVYANTGFDLTDSIFGQPDPDNPATNHTLPFFIVESGSMMRPDSPYGRLGTIDPGDLVVVEKVDRREDIETFYGKGDRHNAGAKGDVLVFLPILRNIPNPPPVVHRAMAYVEMGAVPVPNPRYGEPGQNPYLNVARYTVTEFGIVNAPAITIPELGLYNYAPLNGGFLTRGDNPRSNTWSDQALGVTPYPVPFDRVVGRYKYEVPVVGLAKIALSGQDAALLSPDHEWCTFLAGQAACDTWEVFLLGVIVFVGAPLVITLLVVGRRTLRRHAETRALQAWQEEEAARTAAIRGGAQTDGLDRALPIHDATDLLTGRVRIDTGPPPGQPRDWRDLVGPARVRLDDDPR